MKCKAPEGQLSSAIEDMLKLEPRVRMWRNNSGAVKLENRFVRFGLVGSADFIGLLFPTGRFVALELKSPRGRQTLTQRLFGDLIRANGGFCAVVRSVEEARAVIA